MYILFVGKFISTISLHLARRLFGGGSSSLVLTVEGKHDQGILLRTEFPTLCTMATQPKGLLISLHTHTNSLHYYRSPPKIAYH